MGASADAIAVVREGDGPEVLLVHGGASPTATWAGLERLSERWTLLCAYRRGFVPSPPPLDGRQDFEIDAADIAPLLDCRPHVVAHSYGALGAVIAAARRPASVRSLTLLEPAIFLPADDPEVADFRRMGDSVLTHGPAADEAMLREFLTIAGASIDPRGPLPEAVIRGVRRAQGSRSPGEACLPLDLLRSGGIATLVASGDHDAVIERMCDAVAAAVNAQRVIAPGAGHFVAGAPGFVGRLERFLLAAG